MLVVTRLMPADRDRSDFCSHSHDVHYSTVCSNLHGLRMLCLSHSVVGFLWFIIGCASPPNTSTLRIWENRWELRECLRCFKGGLIRTALSFLQESIDLIDLVLSSQQDELVLFITVSSQRGPLYSIVYSSTDCYCTNSKQTSTLAGGLNVMPVHLRVVTWSERPPTLQSGPLRLQEARIWGGFLAEKVSVLLVLLWSLVSGAGTITAGVNVFMPTEATQAENTHIHVKAGVRLFGGSSMVVSGLGFDVLILDPTIAGLKEHLK